MKKILLIDSNQKFISDLQAKFAGRCEILATDSYQTAYQLVKIVPIEVLLARLPEDNTSQKFKNLQRFLKKLNRKRYKTIIKVLLTSEGGDSKVDELLKQGISAVVVEVGEVWRWIDN